MFPEELMDPLTPKQWKKYNKASRCHICLNNLVTPKKGPKYTIIVITQAITKGPPIGIAT